MRRIITLILLICFSIDVFTQEFKFGGNLGNWVHDWVIDMDLTSDGSIILSTDNQARYWDTNGFIPEETFYGLTKIDKAGKVAWYFDFFRTSFDYHEYSIAQTVLDESDNIYSLIYVYQKTNADIINGITYYPGLNLVKISPQGKVIWIKDIGTTDDMGASILYKNGHIYVLCLYQGDLTLESTRKFSSQKYYQCFQWTYEQGTDYLMTKYDTEGNLMNAVSFGEDYPDIAIDATIDNDENIYFLGVSDYFGGCANAYSHITKVDKNLNIVWKKVTSLQTNNNGLFNATNIHYSANNKIYVWGNIYNKITTEDYTLIRDCGTTGGDFSSCLLEFNSSTGNYFRKMQLNSCSTTFTQGSSDDFRRHFVNGYMTDFDNNLLIHTAFVGTLNIGDTTIMSSYYTDTYNYNLQNMLLLKVDVENLTPKYINTFSGAFNSYYLDFPGKILTDNKNNLYLSGTFSENPIYINNDSIGNNSGNGCYDVLYCKFGLEKLLSDTKEIYPNNDEFILYPNPCTNFLKYRYKDKVDKIQIFNMIGTMIRECEINNSVLDIHDLEPNSYILLFYKDNKIISRKVIVKK